MKLRRISRFRWLGVILGIIFPPLTTSHAFGDAVFEGQIDLLPDSPVQPGTRFAFDVGVDTFTEVDFIPFRVNSDGRVTFDVLAMEGPSLVDVNNDGEFTFIDSVILLYRDDGSLGADDFLGSADDHRGPDTNGSIDSKGPGFQHDSYLELHLAAGDYFLAIGAWKLVNSHATVAGINRTSRRWPATFDDEGDLDHLVIIDHADYRIDFLGDVTIDVPAPPPPETFFIRGDANADGTTNISDGAFVLNYLFVGAESPRCVKSADANDSGDVDLSDGIYILNHLFGGGPPPPAPFPDCGADPTPDNEACDSYLPCS